MGKAAADFFREYLQLGMRVVTLAAQLLEAYGIRELRRPVVLIQVETDADDTAFDKSSVEYVFDEYSTDFFIPDPNIVWPLDAAVLYPFRLEVVQNPESYGATDQLNILSFHPGRLEKHAESEVLSSQ